MLSLLLLGLGSAAENAVLVRRQVLALVGVSVVLLAAPVLVRADVE
ncbi:MAG: hypothetical protein U0528_12580 [Anaerolineae bacterium]